MKKLQEDALSALEEVSEEELSDMVGANGVVKTLTHECHMNTLQFLGTCCGW